MIDAQLLRILDELKGQASSQQYAIGLDMAANEKNWGLAAIRLSNDLNAGALEFLAPQPQLKSDGSSSTTRYCRPSFEALSRLLQLAKSSPGLSALGVDVPLGWPSEQQRFLESWSAVSGWTKTEPLPRREQFERRLGDIALHQFERKIRPLAVGADIIGQAAFVWADCRVKLGEVIDFVDVGLPFPDSQGLNVFESYPAGFVKLNYPVFSDYKSKPAVRKKLFEVLQESMPLELNTRSRAWLEWAFQQKQSPDAFDALLCAYTAWAYLKWKRGNSSIEFTTPQVLLAGQRSELEVSRIETEGWIMIPCQL